MGFKTRNFCSFCLLLRAVSNLQTHFTTKFDVHGKSGYNARQETTTLFVFKLLVGRRLEICESACGNLRKRLNSAAAETDRIEIEPSQALQKIGHRCLQSTSYDLKCD